MIEFIEFIKMLAYGAWFSFLSIFAISCTAAFCYTVYGAIMNIWKGNDDDE